MGWVAAGCCTAIAGFILYRFLVQNLVHSGDGPEVTAQHRQASERPVKIPAYVDSASKSTPQENVNRENLLKASIPLMEVTHTNDASLKPATEKSEPRTAETPEISMPPPPLPKPNRSSSPPRLKPLTATRPGQGSIRPPPSGAASLRVPVTKPLPNASLAPTSSIMPPGKQVSRKVILEPGHSPLDWAALTNNPNNHLRGKDAPGENLLRITPAQLKMQNGRKGRDAWTVYQGKVYNITPYVPFHPGGAGEILRGAGKDSVKLFMEVHPWVNWDGMLSECLVGILVSEEQEATDNIGSLDEMD
ncbi:heme/steroid binding protein [Cladophialophora carrionii]|uniref:Heme/steroid binding protein n=1 Tax=Cladophialophora carrionii TaxID=86049 RepID=A0A1C1CE40_9EURO|nr:heme/steroid binding protein [Cladophialophora carrionii]